MITEVDNLLPAGGLVKKGGKIVITVRAPLLGSGKTNLFKLHRIGEGNLRADRGLRRPGTQRRKEPAPETAGGEFKLHNILKIVFSIMESFASFPRRRESMFFKV
jgi:hypothetical protein